MSRRLERHLTDRIPAVFVNQALIPAEREAVQRDLRMLMRPENRRAFETDRAVTKRRALGANCNNTDMLHRSVPFGHQTTKLKGRPLPLRAYSASVNAKLLVIRAADVARAVTLPVGDGPRCTRP